MNSAVRPKRLLLINGPNLNLLGSREPEIYGLTTLSEVEELTRGTAAELGYEVTAVQSNHEGVLLDAIHDARDTCAGVVINAGALTHTSIGLRDALSGIALLVAEVHISNVHRREDFRHHSYISGIAEMVVVGAGIRGYVYAVQQLVHLLDA